MFKNDSLPTSYLPDTVQFITKSSEPEEVEVVPNSNGVEAESAIYDNLIGTGELLWCVRVLSGLL